MPKNKSISNKRIVEFFVTYHGFFAVPGINRKIGAEGVKFFADAAAQNIEIAGGQIGAANAVAEQNITNNHKF